MGEIREFDAIETGEGGVAAAPWLRRGLTWLSDAVFPPVCLSCRRALQAHDSLCPKCWSKIDFIRAPLCDRLGSPLPYDTGGTMISAAAAADPPDYARARAAGHYTGALRELIHDLKFSDRHAVRALLARLMADAGSDLLAEADVVIPIPLSRRRLLSRRFNQAALLAQTVSKIAGLPYEPLALVRTRATPPQVGLTRNERKLNVRGVFAVPDRFRPHVAGRRVVLVDDVVTTGATCSAATRALLKGGARSVDVLALALVTDKAMMEAS